jgi:pyruvate dehydrogenase E1 component alpha subunit
VGDPQTYRSKEEVAEWRKRDPIQMFRDRVVREGTVAAAELDAIDAKIAKDIAAAVDFARKSPEPDVEAALQDIFTE